MGIGTLGHAGAGRDPEAAWAAGVGGRTVVRAGVGGRTVVGAGTGLAARAGLEEGVGLVGEEPARTVSWVGRFRPRWR
jgi:hypothetical protein